MRKYIHFAICALFVLTACTEKFKPEEEKYVQFSITVQLDTTGASTKTSMADNGSVGKVSWSSTDHLTLFAAGDAVLEKGIVSNDAIVSNDPTSASFTFDVEAEKAEYLQTLQLWLYYGNGNISHVTANGRIKFSISLPANQTHAGSACFNEFENVAFCHCPAGTFKYEVETESYKGTAGCVMRNVFGILKVPITLTGGDVSRVRYVRLTDKTAGQYLAGTFDINFSSSKDTTGMPVLEHKPNTGGESLTIEKFVPKTKALSSSNPYVYFLVPPRTLFGQNGFNISVYTDDGYYGGKTIVPKTGSTVSIKRSQITLLNISSFTPKPIPEPEPLSANSFIFNSDAGLATFPAHYQGNGFQGNGGTGSTAVAALSHVIRYSSDYYPEIIWQTKCNGDTIIAAEVIDSPVYYNGTNGPCISFHKSGVPGNALIALKDASGNILWSWHVWITSEKEATDTGVMLKNQSDGSDVITIMDRNLGALYADPTVSGRETQTHGLGYQFGRKDPYMGSRYTRTDQTTSTEYKSYASIYPGTAIYCIEGTNATNFSIAQSVLYPYQRSLRDSKDWCSELVSWGDLKEGSITATTYKTLYDPCPVGWRTFEEKNIVAALGRDQSGAIIQPIGTIEKSGEGRTFKLTNNGNPIYFPASGLSETTLAVTNVGSVVALWGANYASVLQGQTTHTQAHYIHITINSDVAYTSTMPAGNMENTMSVRCQKWNEPIPTGNTPTYEEDSEVIVL